MYVQKNQLFITRNQKQNKIWKKMLHPMTMMCVAPFLLPLATLAHLRVGLANFDDNPYGDEDDNELGCCCCCC